MLAAVLAPPFLYILLLRTCRQNVRVLQFALRVRTWHNIALALYSAYVAVSSLHKLESSGRLDVWSHGWRPLLCTAGDGSPAFWYASKFWEWFDTVILFARGRAPGALHLGHHASTASMVAVHLYYRAQPTPLFDVATALNACVHMNMYCYYAYPALYRHMKRWITVSQIAQHVTVIALCILASSLHDCDAPTLPYRIALVGYAYYLVMFLRFYRSAY